MKSLAVGLLYCFVGWGAALFSPTDSTAVSGLDQDNYKAMQSYLEELYNPKSPSGKYLSSQFAQRHYDWSRSADFLDDVLEANPDDIQILNKAMVLAMGAGQTEKTIALAHRLIALEKEPAPLPRLFLALDAFRDHRYKEAAETIHSMPTSGLSDFILPVLQSWAEAALGVQDTKALNRNTIHIYHAILISDFLGKREGIEPLLRQSLSAEGLAFQDIERIADIYAWLGKKDIALQLYGDIFESWPENSLLPKKIAALKIDGPFPYFHPIKTPEDGVAAALIDMARLLFQEENDDSALIFARMALFLNGNLSDGHLLLGHIAARNDRTMEAIAHYKAIGPEDPSYAESRRLAADLYEESGQTDQALAELSDLVKNYHDLESIIQTGDIYRRQDDFSNAVEAYNRAAKILGDAISKEFWHLHYVRGISYERLGQWTLAEKDLKAALVLKPDQPLIMNYLGYAWADQGINLDDSLALIRKAAALEPSDGYITDSLGWVLYRRGEYVEAIPHLEQAVELLPYDPVINDHLGDAYWRVGRKTEAKFQWLRAQNHSQDKTLISQIDNKLENGLQAPGKTVKEAHSQRLGGTDL
ncbi:MAG: tetratricopeptide repeat protein [Alphaproteobacteria bacterium]|nr:tetratricopeptide repeat protein [Alphaproteobacteria bacterium]